LTFLRNKKIWIIIAAPIVYFITYISARFPIVTEKFYSTAVYPVLSGVFGRIFGFFPFSLFEVLLYTIIISVICYLIVQIKKIVRDKSNKKTYILNLIINSLVFFSIWYSLFVFTCGINYNRLSFSYHSGLNLRESSYSELADLCFELADSANDIRKALPNDESGIMKSSFATPYQTAVYAGKSFANISEKHPILDGYTPRPKPVLSSKLMSYLNITGIFVPFTYECNVNVDILAFDIPATMMHELAHYKGFMREDEANFISYIACLESENAEFIYSGTMLAFIHSSNALYSVDKDTYYEVFSTLSDNVLTDIAANSTYWQQFKGPVAEVATTVNNTYLQVNRQTDGVKSYGRMVDLLLADYRQRHNISE